MNRRMRNRTYGGVRGRRRQLRPLLDQALQKVVTSECMPYTHSALLLENYYETQDFAVVLDSRICTG